MAEVYNEIIRRCKVSDETLGRLAAWHESRAEKIIDFFLIYLLVRHYCRLLWVAH